jgi:hypothetical protein
VRFPFPESDLDGLGCLSSSVRRTVALLACPAAMAASSETLKDRRCERRWIIGQRSVERRAECRRRLTVTLNLGIRSRLAKERERLLVVSWCLVIDCKRSGFLYAR